MPFQNELQNLVSQVNPELSFYSSLLKVNRESIKPLFLYHIPKTGGMSFQTAIEWSRINLASSLKSNGIATPLPGIGRFGSKDDLKQLNHGFFYLLTSHLPYGAHLLPEVVDFELMCIFRDPVDRISSAYGYQCMRQNKIPTDEGFTAFFRDPENINRFCKQLHPNALNETIEDHKAVIINLNDNFSTIVTMEGLHDAIEYYLSLFNLPNVLQRKINPTLEKFKLDSTPFVDEINSLNEEDYLLYQYVNANQKIPELQDADEETLNQVTSLIFEQQSNKQIAARGIPVETKTFKNKLQKVVDKTITPFDLMLMNFPKIIGKHEGINK